MWDHAQSVFFVGETARLRGNFEEAASRFLEYRRLAEKMMKADPDSPKFQLEGVYSASNLGRVQMSQARYADAAENFQGSVNVMEHLAASEPANRAFLRFSAIGRIGRSTGFESSSMRPSPRKRVRPSQRARV